MGEVVVNAGTGVLPLFTMGKLRKAAGYDIVFGCLEATQVKMNSQEK